MLDAEVVELTVGFCSFFFCRNPLCLIGACQKLVKLMDLPNGIFAQLIGSRSLIRDATL